MRPLSSLNRFSERANSLEPGFRTSPESKNPNHGPTNMKRKPIRQWILRTVALLGGAALCQTAALAFTLRVVDSASNPVTSYRWLLEEDNTALTVPGTPLDNSPSLVIHKSHAPVLANGSVAGSADGTTVIGADPAGRYAVSVLAPGYQLGGANVAVDAGEVVVILNSHPIPTAQINILVFEDHNPINNVPDATEPGLPGFRIQLADFAGGPVLLDAFGNPLGTTYKNVDYATGTFEVDVPGDGFVYTDANGKALIKYLPMGKYGVQAVSPKGSDWTGGHGSANVKSAWNQTATIEGTLTVDAWVKANEPMVFMEGFGPGNYHVFFGFVKPDGLPANTTAGDPAQNIGQPTQAGNVTITGVNRFNHFGRPPNNQQFAVGPPVSDAWIGLNEIGALGVAGRGLYAAPCDPATGEFSIANVPPGTYQLVTWDRPLDALFGFNTIVVPAPAGGGAGTLDLGNVLSFRWFGTLEGSVFYDVNENGYRDAVEEGIPNQAVNLRWRDGTVYQATLTDNTGDYALSEVFPFFKWLVAEVDFLRFKATGMTAIVDGGGDIPTTGLAGLYADGVRNPQPQFVLNADGTQSATPTNNASSPYANDNLSRTEVGPVLTEAVHLFLNQNNRIDWGKNKYGPGENGGISGIVGYQTTRAEEDPRFGTIDPWESGIPRVQVALYQDANGDKIIDDLDGDGQPTVADVDNHPIGWSEPGGTKGPEDFDHNGNGAFDQGDALQVAWSDSWDDNLDADPTLGAQQPEPPVVLEKPIVGSDNYATWNQIRPQVFDGGYAFGDVAPGYYIVQTFPPPGYMIQTEESVNVAYGDAYIPSKLALPPELVGTADNHVNDLAYLQTILPSARAGNPFTVPAQFSLFPSPDDEVPFAGATRPLADMKYVRVADGFNTAADFHVYTEVPKSTRVVGFVLNDLTAEFNAASVIFGEKGAPGWIPISFRDWAGHEVARTYADEYGSYNALLPSTYTVNAPMPSGVAPQMLTMVLNDPTMPDPANPNNRVADPYYNPSFATTPWTLHYYPGMFLYADTPIVPIAGFVGGANKTLDVEPPTGTPMIKSVEGTTYTDADGAVLAGPWIVSRTETVTIRSLGLTQVPNPDYVLGAPPSVIPATIERDYGFGTAGAAGSQVTLHRANGEANLFRPGNTWTCAVTSWDNDTIQVTLPATLPAGPADDTWELIVWRGGVRTPTGITLTIEPDASRVHFVKPAFYQGNPTASAIQDAIDAANPGDLILVTASPNEYSENPILWKPLRLQGSGLGTIINASTTPADRLAAWHSKVQTILGGDPFVANEAPGIMVLGQNILGVGGPVGTLSDSGFATASYLPRIDGFQIKGAIAGGAISVWHKATNLRVSNNRMVGNQGSFAGGISVGMQDNLGSTFDNANILIELNQIIKNAGVNGGGGVGIHTGATDYRVVNNIIAGNFTRGFGAGVSHEGLSPGGLIAGNTIAFNEVFYGAAAGVGGDGGGIYVGGIAAPGGLSSGSGSVTIINNLIQGNLAGSGHGGGIRAAGVNGADVLAPGGVGTWYRLDIINNMIVNNAAGFAGGGISLKDATRVRIRGNTIANNDSTATALAAFAAGMTDSTPRGAGIVGHAHSALLAANSGQTFSNPDIDSNIIWHNRSYYYDGTAQTLAPATPLYADLAVDGVAGSLSAQRSITSAPYPGLGNLSDDPSFVTEYLNLPVAARVTDEAGNSISLRFEPTGLYDTAGAVRGDYHINGDSPGIDRGSANANQALTSFDFDMQARVVNYPGVTGNGADIGADERPAAGGTTPANTAYTWPAPLHNGPQPDPANAPGVTAPVNSAGVPPGEQVRPEQLLLSTHANNTAINIPGGAPNNGPANPYPSTITVPAGFGTVGKITVTLHNVNHTRPADIDALLVAPGGQTVRLMSDVGGNGDLVNVTLTFDDAAPTALTAAQIASGTYRPSNVGANDPFAAPAPAAPYGATLSVFNGTNPTGAWRLFITDDLGGGAQAGNRGSILGGWSMTLTPATVAPLTLNPDPGTATSLPAGPAFLDPTILAALDKDTALDEDGDGNLSNDVDYYHLAAGDGFATMGSGEPLYIFGFSDVTGVKTKNVFLEGTLKANVAAPTLVFREGRHAYLDVSNVGMVMRPDLFDPHTVHFHGFPNAATIYDGEPMASISVNMGATIRYYYQIVEPGTYLYHCHVEATEHMQMGMIGNLFVYPKQNNLANGTSLNGFIHETGFKYAYNDGDGSTYYDKELPLQVTGFDANFHRQHILVQPLPFAALYDDYPLLNGRGYPDTVSTAPIVTDGNASQPVSSTLTATVGEKILLRLSNVSVSDFHTLTIQGLKMKVVGKDARHLRGPTGRDLSYTTTSLTLGGGESADAIVDTTGAVPGTYFIYSTKLNHLSNEAEDFGGIMTEITLSAP